MNVSKIFKVLYIISGLSAYSAEHGETPVLVLGSYRKKEKNIFFIVRCCTKPHSWIKTHLTIKSSLIRMLYLISFVASAGIEALGTWALWPQLGKVLKNMLSFKLVSSPT